MGVIITPPAAPVAQSGVPVQPAPVFETAATPVSATAAANTAVVITINGVAGQSIRLQHLSFSYNAAPTGGAISVVVNAVTIFQLDDAALTDVTIPLPPGGLLCQAGQNAVITLAAAGAAVVGKLNAGFTQR